ncbi:MAG: acyl-CoA dehydratase activase, partial [Desulfobacterales bacterium]|nr:acyl-CoA dehydratase activase [Desulfobacterales bacterium]
MKLGIDIGSTTAKTVILDQNGHTQFSEYKRHNAEILESLIVSLEKALLQNGDITIDTAITGSAGLGIAEKYGLSFVQELVASTNAANKLFPQVKTLIDIGGEDSKIIFFSNKKRPDIRMNGSCAGGTGSFIDQMATLLDVSIGQLDKLASQHTTILPIASRCGVFAKTDVQNLLSQEASKEDIAASIFHAVAIQIITTLSRGYTITPTILFCGGPLSFLPSLGHIFIKALNLSSIDILRPDHPELFPAIGAAISSEKTKTLKLSELLNRLKTTNISIQTNQNRLPSLFNSSEDFSSWNDNRLSDKISRIDLSQATGNDFFLGIDSGSTTTKIVLIDTQGNIVFNYYTNNRGKPIEAVVHGLQELKERTHKSGKNIHIQRSGVTGYGEDLIKTAFGLDDSVVETIAHYKASKVFNEDVSFILDIGGQDMKAIFVEDGVISNIEVNEACSSGCGSFLESFSKNLGYGIDDFASIACAAENPCNLGTRCTVFMNSKVKQALREGASVNEISAGLAYSIVKNFLYKVLKVRDISTLGNHIVVQGGTFKNPAVHRAFETIIGKKILCPEITELMGAYGAALSALKQYKENPNDRTCFSGLDDLATVLHYKKKRSICKGCNNQCPITILTFENQNRFYTGNRCERIFSNQAKNTQKGFNLPDYKYELLFNRQTEPEKMPLLTIGIPRVLNFFENFPFWNTLFVKCGIKVELSPDSSEALCEKGYHTVMSENICYPAKIVHGHILHLINADVDRIFYPIIPFENNQFQNADNYYNCPIVSGYPDVIRNSMDPDGKYGVPFDSPTVTFNDMDLLKKSCFSYLKQFGVKKQTFKKAFTAAIQEQARFKKTLQTKTAELIIENKKQDRFLLLLAGRPYHVDPLINHNIPKYIADLGVDVITEDSLPDSSFKDLSGAHVLTQWVYTNRLFEAANWASVNDHVEFIQLNSFGCGPDALSVDEVKSILNEHGKNQTLIRIDENSSPGSVKLRIRSLVESLRLRNNAKKQFPVPRITARSYSASKDKGKIMISPDFGPFYSDIMPKIFKTVGIQLKMLPPDDKKSVEIGLQYINNEICYPAIIVIGNILKELMSGKYDPDEVFVGLTQTGGQCRASSYTSLIKKALVSAGFKDVPVASVPTGHYDISGKSELTVDVNSLLTNGFLYFLYADSIIQMYNSTVFREKTPGSTLAVINKYLSKEMLGFDNPDLSLILSILKNAVNEFNCIDIKGDLFPKIGLVGEIYVKYNSL